MVCVSLAAWIWIFVYKVHSEEDKEILFLCAMWISYYTGNSPDNGILSCYRCKHNLNLLSVCSFTVV